MTFRTLCYLFISRAKEHKYYTFNDPF